MDRLTPSDRRLAAILGLTPEEFQHFNNEARRLAAAGPQPAVTAGIDPLSILVNVALAAGSLAISSLLAPRPPGRPPTIVTSQQRGDTLTLNQRFAPTSGFDSYQEPAKLQTTIPCVYANRETIGGTDYGGVRVNLLLLWSQMLSFKTHQMFRGVFLVGEGAIGELDPYGFAVGDTLLTSYSVMMNDASTRQGARYTVYVKKDGGRLTQGDRIAGRSPDRDPGNAQRAGASDVYQVRSSGNLWLPSSCTAATPSAALTFGVYSPISNNLGYRVNPQLRPTRTFRVVGDDYRADSEDDNLAKIAIWKARYHWSPRSGIVSCTDASGSEKLLGEGQVDVVVGDRIFYRQVSSSDVGVSLRFAETVGNSDNEEEEKEFCGEIASAIAARQTAADDALVVDTLYQIGSCWAVLQGRDPAELPFVSTASFNAPDDSEREPASGNSITYGFVVIKPGTINRLTEQQIRDLEPLPRSKVLTPPDTSNDGEGTWDRAGFWTGDQDMPTYGTATNTAQIFRLAVATFSVPRPCLAVEIGIRSRLGMQVNGVCNMRQAPNLNEIDEKAQGGYRSGDPVDNNGTNTKVSIYQSGQISRVETRYSFFRIAYRASARDTWIELPPLFGVRGDTSQDIYNYIRLWMPSVQPWEFSLYPVTGWEIRNRIGMADDVQKVLLDCGLQGDYSVTVGDINIYYTGLPVGAFSADDYRLTFIEPQKDLYLNWTDEDGNAMFDTWGKLAEAFMYDEIKTSCEQGPEHTIAYINTITNNAEVPLYDNLALVGLNISSSTEMRQLGQLSGYVTSGIAVRRLLTDTEGPTHLWPEILLDAAINNRYGTGDRMTIEQIDVESFKAAAQWCHDRKYFFDGVIESPRNLRQWAADLAPLFVLTFGERNGQWYLAPAIDFNPIQISGLFTAGNIQEDTFQLVWADADDRQPIKVSATWRQERLNLSAVNSGLFPTPREVLVREVATPLNASLQSINMSEFATNQQHAVDACKLIAGYRTYTDHRIQFETTYDLEYAAIAPDAYIRVEMIETYVSGFGNGVCTADGVVTSTSPLADGSYQVFAWDGTASRRPSLQAMTIRNGIGSLPGHVFTIYNAAQQARTYRVERVAPTQDGRFTVEAAHAPTGDDGRLLLAAKWNNPNSWVIES